MTRTGCVVWLASMRMKSFGTTNASDLIGNKGGSVAGCSPPSFQLGSQNICGHLSS